MLSPFRSLKFIVWVFKFLYIYIFSFFFKTLFDVFTVNLICNIYPEYKTCIRALDLASFVQVFFISGFLYAHVTVVARGTSGVWRGTLEGFPLGNLTNVYGLTGQNNVDAAMSFEC